MGDFCQWLRRKPGKRQATRIGPFNPSDQRRPRHRSSNAERRREAGRMPETCSRSVSPFHRLRRETMKRSARPIAPKRFRADCAAAGAFLRSAGQAPERWNVRARPCRYEGGTKSRRDLHCRISPAMEMLPARAPERWGFDGAGHPHQGNWVKAFRMAATPPSRLPREGGDPFSAVRAAAGAKEKSFRRRGLRARFGGQTGAAMAWLGGRRTSDAVTATQTICRCQVRFSPVRAAGFSVRPDDILAPRSECRFPDA